MVEVSSTGRKILYDNDINFTNPTPVIQLYPRAYGQTDSFAPSDKQKKKPSFLGHLAKGIIGVGLLWFAGKKGLFGKAIKNKLNRSVSNKNVDGIVNETNDILSDEKFSEIVKEKMKGYLEKWGLKVKSSEIVEVPGTGKGPKHMYRATLDDGTVKEYSIKETKEFFKLKGKRIQDNSNNRIIDKILDRGKPTQTIEERLVFARKDGTVISRTDLKRASNGTIEAYARYQGENVLNKDYNEVTGIYKDYFHKGPFRKFLIVGPKIETHTVRTFDGMGNPAEETVRKIIRNKSGIIDYTINNYTYTQ